MSDRASSGAGGPRCPAHWAADEHQDGRQCKFRLERRDGEWWCPAHGTQTVTEQAELEGFA